jgi:hypothetical protein
MYTREEKKMNITAALIWRYAGMKFTTGRIEDDKANGLMTMKTLACLNSATVMRRRC